jgi:hypothetical protein
MFNDRVVIGDGQFYPITKKSWEYWVGALIFHVKAPTFYFDSQVD